MPRRKGSAEVPVWLLDTSVWIDVFRKNKPFDLAKIGGLDEVVTCLPVVQEVLQGFRDEAAFRVAKEAMLALPCVALSRGPAGGRDREVEYRLPDRRLRDP